MMKVNGFGQLFCYSYLEVVIQMSLFNQTNNDNGKHKLNLEKNI